MSDERSSKSSIVNPYAAAMPPLIPTELAEYQDLYRNSPTADRAYEKFLARGSNHGHDVEDWLSSEREIEDEHQASIDRQDRQDSNDARTRSS